MAQKVRVMLTTWNRTFFGSEETALTGLGPPDAKVGDIIVLLYGCSIHVVLRETRLDYKDRKPVYRLMGEAFVLSTM